MFIGHYAVAFAAKKAAPKVSLGWLVAAANFIDYVFPVLLLAGVEHARIAPGFTAVVPLDFYDYPWSHSLLMTTVYGALLGGVYFAWKKERGAALLLVGVTVSHWLLDVASHAADMPIAPGVDMRLGFGLWNSFAATMAVEIPLFLAGVWLYLSTLHRRSRRAKFGIPVFAAFLFAIYIANLFGPPPPGVTALGVAGLMPMLFVPLCHWLDADTRPRLLGNQLKNGVK